MKSSKLKIPAAILLTGLAGGALSGCHRAPISVLQPAVAATMTPTPTQTQRPPKVTELSPDAARLVEALLRLKPAEPDL